MSLFGIEFSTLSVLCFEKQQLLGVGYSLVLIIWICEAEKSLKFDTFGNLSFKLSSLWGFQMWVWKKRSYMIRMAILVEKNDWIFINMERKIQVKHLRRLILISWIFFYSKPLNKASLHTSISVVINSNSNIFLQLQHTLNSFSTEEKYPRKHFSQTEMSMRNSSLLNVWLFKHLKSDLLNVIY